MFANPFIWGKPAPGSKQRQAFQRLPKLCSTLIPFGRITRTSSIEDRLQRPWYPFGMPQSTRQFSIKYILTEGGLILANMAPSGNIVSGTLQRHASGVNVAEGRKFLVIDRFGRGVGPIKKLH